MNLLSVVNTGSTRTWIIATAISVLLLLLVLSQLDLDQFAQMLINVKITSLMAAIALLLCEGILTAQRIRLFCRGQQQLNDTLLANAWYSILIVLLPARLGEVAAVVVLEKLLNQTRGGAMMSIISQRLFDVAVLSSLFIIALLTTIDILPPALSAFIAIIVISSTLLSIVYMEQLLSFIALFLMRNTKPAVDSIRHSILRIVLQARIWCRHSRHQGLNVMALFITTLKWLCTLTAVSLLFNAVSAPLSIADALAASAAYNFIAVIPIQTIGGLGIGEVGLAAVLVGMGISLSLAVAISIFVRIILILFPFIFFALVFIWRNLFTRRIPV